jgi:hypothetical protein
LEFKEVSFMATNCDFGRSSLLIEQYQREMEIIAFALQEESQDEREERLNLVARSWSLTSACFHAQLESSESPTFASVAFARP